MLHGVLHSAAARAAVLMKGQGDYDMALRLFDRIMRAGYVTVLAMAAFAQQGMAMDTAPSPGLPAPSPLLTHNMRTSIWWWRYTAVDRKHKFNIPCVTYLTRQALHLLGLAAPVGGWPPGAVPCPSGPIAIAALDALALLVPYDGSSLAAAFTQQQQPGWTTPEWAGLEQLVQESAAVAGSAAFSLSAGRAHAPLWQLRQ